jgi:hypothetical protein
MDELLAAADIVVSKPGGLTTSEVLARGAAMVILNPIPGQESRNSDYLLERGAAVNARNRNGETALMLFAKKGDAATVKAIIARCREHRVLRVGCAEQAPGLCARKKWRRQDARPPRRTPATSRRTTRACVRPRQNEAALRPPRKYALRPVRGALTRQVAGGNSSPSAWGTLIRGASISRTSNRRS